MIILPEFFPMINSYFHEINIYSNTNSTYPRVRLSFIPTINRNYWINQINVSWENLSFNPDTVHPPCCLLLPMRTRRARHTPTAFLSSAAPRARVALSPPEAMLPTATVTRNHRRQQPACQPYSPPPPPRAAAASLARKVVGVLWRRCFPCATYPSNGRRAVWWLLLRWAASGEHGRRCCGVFNSCLRDKWV